jgi:hypothetical protein
MYCIKGDTAAERLLDCLVNDAHSAVADLAQDAILAESLESGS